MDPWMDEGGHGDDGLIVEKIQMEADDLQISALFFIDFRTKPALVQSDVKKKESFSTLDNNNGSVCVYKL